MNVPNAPKFIRDELFRNAIASLPDCDINKAQEKIERDAIKRLNNISQILLIRDGNKILIEKINEV